MNKIKNILSNLAIALLFVVTFVGAKQIGLEFNRQISSEKTEFVTETAEQPVQIETAPDDFNQAFVESETEAVQPVQIETAPDFNQAFVESETEAVQPVTSQEPTSTQEQTTDISYLPNLEDIVIPTGIYYDIDINGKLTSEIAIKIDNIIFVGETGADNDVLLSAYDDIKNLSPALKEAIKMIVITPDDLAKKFKFPDTDIGRISGIANGSTIYITDYKYEEYVLIHEAMHCIDNYYGIPEEDIKYRSRTAEWKSLYEANTYTHRDCWYLRTSNADEYFASVGQLWYMDPEYTKEMFPEESQFFEELLGEKMNDRAEYELKRLSSLSKS